MNAKALFLALTLSVVAPVTMAQDKAATSVTKPDIGCPIEYTAMLHSHAGQRSGVWLNTWYTNKTEKTISGSKFGVILYDEVGDPHDYVYSINSAQTVKPGKGGVSKADMPTVQLRDYWGKSLKDPLHRVGVQLYAIKILFSDGTAWVDDGTKSCASFVD